MGQSLADLNAGSTHPMVAGMLPRGTYDGHLATPSPPSTGNLQHGSPAMNTYNGQTPATSMNNGQTMASGNFQHPSSAMNMNNGQTPSTSTANVQQPSALMNMNNGQTPGTSTANVQHSGSAAIGNANAF